MDFYLTEELKRLQGNVAEFADQVIAPLANIVDQTGQIPAEVFEKAADLNILGLAFPKEYGGSAVGYLGFVIALEEIARVCASTAFVMASHLGPTELISLYGTPEQKEKYLYDLVQGKYVGAFAATEPEAGSDLAASLTSAKQADDNWIINGRKIFVTNANRAHIMIVTAITEARGRNKERLSLFLVPAGTPGFTIGSKYNKLGMRGVGNYEVFFDDCALPADHLVGKRGAGYADAIEMLNRMRIAAAAISIGIARVCLESSLAYAKKRMQFGKALSNFQAIRFKLADMATQLELARLMTHKAAWLLDNKQLHRKEAAMAKLFASEVASAAASHALQIHGGAAYTTDYSQERYLRDAKLLEIADGTSEMLRIMISKQIGC